MRTIKFNYLYHDGSNYKKWVDVIFYNHEGLSAEAVATDLHNACLPDGLFIAHQVRIPEAFLWLEDRLDADDHCFHEFAGVESTSEAPNDVHSRSIREFVAEVQTESQRGWRAFNPQDRLFDRSSKPAMLS
jgi:hypothetical protein